MILLLFLLLLTTQSLAATDSYGRLTSWPTKVKVECPIQNYRTGVLFVIGQSNAANCASKSFKTQSQGQVINYFDGECYSGGDPILGTTCSQGSFITPLADMLIKNKTYDNVVIINTAIGSTSIKRWGEGGDINKLMNKVIDDFSNKYSPTDIIWHQGETDFVQGTSTANYKKYFSELKNNLRNKNIIAPMYVAIASKCNNGTKWTFDNQITRAQYDLIDFNDDVYEAVNTDLLLDIKDRQSISCHFSESGQYKTALSYFNAIETKKVYE